MVSAKQKEYAEVSACSRIPENNDIITDFQTDKLGKKILQSENLNKAFNLIDNAIKASNYNDRICVQAYLENGNPVIEVTDSGKGMTEEQLGHIKEAFYRVDHSRNRRDGGVGLGLSICEQIAEVHVIMNEKGNKKRIYQKWL